MEGDDHRGAIFTKHFSYLSLSEVSFLYFPNYPQASTSQDFPRAWSNIASFNKILCIKEESLLKTTIYLTISKVRTKQQRFIAKI